ncbi:mRNA-capping enzyme-like [Tubulanus polymorphus]|uniref:mRNA-capping enzyme-like n=1 Tax=Tubulanus polymorphus TaxID=672921 RepID=UPI003DA66DAC
MAGKQFNKIPPRWLNCPRKGSIINNKFLPFKTLLDGRYDGEVPESNRWNLEMLMLSSKMYKVRKGKHCYRSTV